MKTSPASFHLPNEPLLPQLHLPHHFSAPTPAPAPVDSSVYQPTKGVAWKFIQQMVGAEASCPGCHFRGDAVKLKFHQEVDCPELSKNSYVCHKDKAATEVVTTKFS